MPTLPFRSRSFAAHRRILSGSALSVAAFAGLALAEARATGPIAPTDLLVFQQGDGNTVPTAAGSPLDILEINPALTAQTLAVQTFQISSQSAPLFTSSDGSDGFLALSNNGTLLTFSGWTSSGSTETSVLGRAAGTLNAAGLYTQPATYTANATNSQTRSAYSPDGANFYFDDKTGIYSNGGTAPVNPTNVREIKAFGSSIFALQQSASAPLLSILTPTQPNGSSATLTAIPGFSGVFNNKAVDFTMVSSGTTPGLFDTLYVVDNTGILKYGLLGGTWTAEGEITSNLGTKLDGITASVGAGGIVDLFVTSDSSTTGDLLEEVTDSASFNATAAGPANPTVLYTAPAGVLLAGVSTAPQAVPEPASLGLILFGSLGLLARRRRKA